jgi:hypothetical protein
MGSIEAAEAIDTSYQLRFVFFEEICVPHPSFTSFRASYKDCKWMYSINLVSWWIQFLVVLIRIGASA